MVMMEHSFKAKLAKTKKGATSLYVVVFTSILFGVIALSFLRIVLSEASQTSNDDFSRSAYDAAMAGVEDAKTAVNKYYTCLKDNDANSCSHATLFRESCNPNIGLAEYLYGSNYSGGEVLIQENSVNNAADNNSNQAYTCVIVSDVVPDYRGTLTSDTRTKVVPLRIYDGTNAATTGTIDSVQFQWYSSLNEGDADPNTTFKLADGDLHFGDSDNKTVPPTIQLTYIKVGATLNLDNFHQANSDGTYEYSTMVILPNGKSTTGVPLNIDSNARNNAGNISSGTNSPFGVTCSTTNDFACTVNLTNANIGPTDTAFLVVSLPYKETVSDFSVTLRNGEDIVDFEGVQVSVDSTGRTGQLLRRVETRLDPADLFFPYPQYALELRGDPSDDALKKNFWITANCWYSQPSTGGTATVCNNNGNVGS